MMRQNDHQILSKMSDLIEVATETGNFFFTFYCPASTCATAVAHRAAAGSGFEVSISCNFPTELCCSALPLASSMYWHSKAKLYIPSTINK